MSRKPRDRGRGRGKGGNRPERSGEFNPIEIGPDDKVSLSPAARAMIDRILDGISRDVGRPVSSDEMFNALRTLRQKTGKDNPDLRDPEVLAVFMSILGKSEN